nr:hypothetical protein [Tanacetum cinerariifolium]
PRKMAVDNKWEQGDVVSVSAPGVAKPLNLPVLIQPGQAEGTVAIAVGYGRVMAGKVGNNVGDNAFPLAQVGRDSITYVNNVTLKATGAKSPIAQTQTHHTIMDRR